MTTPMDMQPEMAEEQPKTSPGYCIEIRVYEDGRLEVGVEDIYEDEEEHEDSGDEPKYQPVESIGDAIRIVREVYQAAGSTQGDMEQREAMQGAYDKAERGI